MHHLNANMCKEIECYMFNDRRTTNILLNLLNNRKLAIYNDAICSKRLPDSVCGSQYLMHNKW